MELLYTDLAGELKVLVFDATLKEVPSYTATPANHPIERGADITDHVRQEKDKLSVEAFVTNKPIKASIGSYAGPEGGELGGVIDSLDLGSFTDKGYKKGATVSDKGKVNDASYNDGATSTFANTLQFPEPFNRKQIVHDILLDIKTRAVECSVGIGLKVWDSMLIVNLGAPQDAQSGTAVTFTIDFEEVRFANSQTVDTPEPLETRAEREERLGEQSEEEPTPDDRSAALHVFNAIGDALEQHGIGRGVF